MRSTGFSFSSDDPQSIIIAYPLGEQIKLHEAFPTSNTQISIWIILKIDIFCRKAKFRSSCSAIAWQLCNFNCSTCLKSSSSPIQLHYSTLFQTMMKRIINTKPNESPTQSCHSDGNWDITADTIEADIKLNRSSASLVFFSFLFILNNSC